MEDVNIQISPELAASLALIARSEDATTSEVIRDALRRDVKRRLASDRDTNSHKLAPLRALLTDDFATASDWDDLTNRLARKGFRLHQIADSLSLHRLTGEQICLASDIDFRFADIFGRFDLAFPGAPMPARQALAG